MPPPCIVTAIKTARDQLAALYLRYRKKGLQQMISHADRRIEKALRQHPQGGHPGAGTNQLKVHVFPLQETYEIVGDTVKIVEFIDTSAP